MKEYNKMAGTAGVGGKEEGIKYSLLKTSLTFQTGEYFENSTLHGVRYIDEPRRPFCEKFMWFCVTSVGGVATLIIIASLWEKFQTNPTITGLDTDFHNWDVAFPSVAVCPVAPSDAARAAALVQSKWPDVGKAKNDLYVDLLLELGNISWPTLERFNKFAGHTDLLSKGEDMRALSAAVQVRCQDTLSECAFKGDIYPCCSQPNASSFSPLLTEFGPCFIFNNRHADLANQKPGETFKAKLIFETDEKWQLSFLLSRLQEAVGMPDLEELVEYNIFIQSNDEIPTLGVDAQHAWDGNIAHISFGAKQTYTTQDADQLSIRQRRCVFPHEIKLVTDEIYTYTACMSQCRMNIARRLCQCVPFFYKPTEGYQHCDLPGLVCLSKNIDSILRGAECDCALGCSNTVYEVEKLLNRKVKTDETPLEVAFISWPMVRYKREVLFGWVDLLVSFGGIAGLFLGFSLLSGVELLYYFSMRACCMVHRDAARLRELRNEYDAVERPPLDLSLTPKFMRRVGASLSPSPAPLKVAPFTIRPLRPIMTSPFDLEFLP